MKGRDKRRLAKRKAVTSKIKKGPPWMFKNKSEDEKVERIATTLLAMLREKRDCPLP